MVRLSSAPVTSHLSPFPHLPSPPYAIVVVCLQLKAVNWAAVFRSSFTLLFLAYPGVSLKVLRVFKCREVDGQFWLVADMRLQCYTSEWAGYAAYSIFICAVYVVGLPVGQWLMSCPSCSRSPSLSPQYCPSLPRCLVCLLTLRDRAALCMYCDLDDVAVGAVFCVTCLCLLPPHHLTPLVLCTAVLVLLWRRRRSLFGTHTTVESTQATFGFLYLDYGPTAWLWEVEVWLVAGLPVAVAHAASTGNRSRGTQEKPCRHSLNCCCCACVWDQLLLRLTVRS